MSHAYRRSLKAHLSIILAASFGSVVLAQDAMDEMSMDEMSMSDMSETGFSPEEIAFFESKVRPLLISACGGCHYPSSGRLRGGLSLETRESMILGGNEGPAIIPGDPDASLLIQAIKYQDPNFEMPPRGAMSRDEIAILEEWVRMGAPFPEPREDADLGVAPGTEHRWSDEDIESGRSHWAYRPLKAPVFPALKENTWAWHDLDRFVLAGMEARGTTPVRDAESDAWLRRVTFDLTGLPPRIEDVEAFTREESPDTRARVVDRLLASDAFGERWGRHWLDVARYAESSGKESNVIYPHSWRYRDYVIDAFNQDKPFNTFIREQLAGDLLPASGNADRAENLVATGFLAVGVKGHNTRGKAQFIADLVDEQIDAVTQGFLGTTVSCARCHDHKFDPIPQRDYYAMAGIFVSTDTRFGTYSHQGNNHFSNLIVLPEDSGQSAGTPLPSQVRSIIQNAYRLAQGRADEAEELREQIQQARRSGNGVSSDVQRAFQRARNAQGTVTTTNSILERFDESGKPTEANMVCVGTLEGNITNAPILERGEITRAGEDIPRGFVQVISGDWTPYVRSGSGRMQLADWIASSQNPLTARVWSNRVWLHLFGKGIVATPDNFGRSGQAPTNQALLDHLATNFIDNDYSTKSLIRQIVLSRTYQLSSNWSKANVAIDPDVNSLWRMPKRRLEAEAIRDSMLTAAGTLDLQRPEGSASNPFEGALRRPNDQFSRGLELIMEDFNNHRSVYLPIIRERIPEALSVFDFPDPSFVTGERANTNVATQALYLMNSEEVIDLADNFARRLISMHKEPRDRINSAFKIAFGRSPSTNEFIACRDFLGDFYEAARADQAQRPAAQSRQSTPRRQRGAARNRMAERNRSRERDQPQPLVVLDPETLAWSGLCQSLFQSTEFRTID